jgi:hypothetical protein
LTARAARWYGRPQRRILDVTEEPQGQDTVNRLLTDTLAMCARVDVRAFTLLPVA